MTTKREPKTPTGLSRENPQIKITMPPGVLRKLDEFCRRDNLTRSQAVVRAIEVTTALDVLVGDAVAEEKAKGASNGDS